jgi:hypothetical protein
MRGINKDHKEKRNMPEDLSWGRHNPKHIPKNSPRQELSMWRVLVKTNSMGAIKP